MGFVWKRIAPKMCRDSVLSGNAKFLVGLADGVQMERILEELIMMTSWRTSVQLAL